MTDEVKTPPAGLLATQALGTEPAAPVERKPEDAPSPAKLPVDPNYVEPYPYSEFARMAQTQSRIINELTPSMGLEVAKICLEQVTLIKFLLARLRVLEAAVKPFAVTGMVFSNARMNLIAQGDANEPAGGTWISNPPQGITLQPNEGLYYNATDAYGRQATHDHMAASLVKIQESNKLQAEKNAHVESGGKIQ